MHGITIGNEMGINTCAAFAGTDSEAVVDGDFLDIAQKLQAVESAVASAKKTLVHDHIDHCLDDAIRTGTRSADDTLREFKVISKYLQATQPCWTS